MDINYIISPVMGAIIAGLSNRMAIKMLFFPAEPKYLFGIKIPFTPGIIPKERARIAQSIGETAGSYILNEEGIIKAFTYSDIDKKIRIAVKDLINNLQSQEITVGQFLEDLLVNRFSLNIGLDKAMHTTASYISKYVLDLLDHPDFDREIRKNLDLLFNSLSEMRIGDIPKNEQFEGLIDKLEDAAISLLQSENSLNNIKLFLLQKIDGAAVNNHTLSMYLNENQQKAVKDFLSTRTQHLCRFIDSYLKDETVKEHLKKYISFSLSQNLMGKLIMKFINTEKITAYVFSELHQFLTSYKGQREVANILVRIVENSYSTEIRQIVSKMGYDEARPYLDELLKKLLVKLITRENIHEVFNKLKNFIENSKDKTIGEILVFISDETATLKLKLLISELIVNIINSAEIRPKISGMLEHLLEIPLQSILSRKLDDVLKISDTDMVRIQDFTVNTVKDLVIGNSGSILKFIDIPKITTDRINELNIEEMEDLILKIVEKDLWALTILEASLGFIIGLLTPVITHLFSLML